MLHISLSIIGLLSSMLLCGQSYDTIKVIEFTSITKGVVCNIDGKLISKKRYYEIIEMDKEFGSLNEVKYVMVYDKNNHLLYACLFKSPEIRVGEIKYFYKKNKLKVKGMYDDGEKVGTWIFYSKKGEIIKKERL